MQLGSFDEATLMRNQMDKNMENDMETSLVFLFLGVFVLASATSPRLCVECAFSPGST